jgi:hypothetical protein
LEILAYYRYGEIENSNEVADFKAISARNRMSIAYFGLKSVSLKCIRSIMQKSLL